MGSGVSMDHNDRFMLFANPKIVDTYNKFIIEPSANESFAAFIKDGMWLSSVTHNHAARTALDASSDSEVTYKSHLPSAVLEKSISTRSSSWTRSFSTSSSTTSVTKSTTAITNSTAAATMLQHFQDSYYVGQSDKVSMEDLQQFMFMILFPLYFLSKDYQLWLQWKNFHRKTVAFKQYRKRIRQSRSLGSSSSSVDSIESDIFYDDKMNSDRNPYNKVSQEIFLSTAAYYDEYQQEESLLQNTRLFSGLHDMLEDNPFGITVCDARVHKCGVPILYSNRTMETMTGHDLAGCEYDVLVGEDTEQDLRKRLSDSFTSMRSCNICITNYRKGGSKFLHMYVTKPVFDSCGHCVFIACVHYDLSNKAFTHKDHKTAQDLLSIVSLLLQSSICYDNVFCTSTSFKNSSMSVMKDLMLGRD